MLNIATLNIHGIPLHSDIYLRFHEFASQLEKSDVDVINIQEVHTYDLIYMLKRDLVVFPNMSYAKGLIGPRAGLVTFSRKPISKLHFQRTGLHKGVLASKLDRETVLFNAHLLANHDGNWSLDNRFYSKHMKQLRVLLNQIKFYENQGFNIIVTGDFNIAKTSRLYEYFLKDGGLIDSFSASNAPTFRSDFLPADRTAQCIDYIFIKGSLKAENGKFIFKDEFAKRNGKPLYVSDHLGLCVSVEGVSQ